MLKNTVEIRGEEDKIQGASLEFVISLPSGYTERLRTLTTFVYRLWTLPVRTIHLDLAV